LAFDSPTTANAWMPPGTQQSTVSGMLMRNWIGLPHSRKPSLQPADGGGWYTVCAAVERCRHRDSRHLVGEREKLIAALSGVGCGVERCSIEPGG
jgi:hypothetical protein